MVMVRQQPEKGCCRNIMMSQWGWLLPFWIKNVMNSSLLSCQAFVGNCVGISIWMLNLWIKIMTFDLWSLTISKSNWFIHMFKWAFVLNSPKDSPWGHSTLDLWPHMLESIWMFVPNLKSFHHVYEISCSKEWDVHHVQFLYRQPRNILPLVTTKKPAETLRMKTRIFSFHTEKSAEFKYNVLMKNETFNINRSKD